MSAFLSTHQRNVVLDSSCYSRLYVTGVLVAVAAELETKGPVGWHIRATNQLKVHFYIHQYCRSIMLPYVDSIDMYNSKL